MSYRDRIFDAFKPSGKIPSFLPLLKIRGGTLFAGGDHFGFFRKEPPLNQYIPKTQAGLRKAFAAGLIGIEHFLQMATSLRPLSDEAQDVDEITKLFSQQKLASRPDAASVRILRNMIKDPDPEIALYAAEGLNTIENTYIGRIQRVKKRMGDVPSRRYIFNYLLGCLYLEFAGIMEGQELIRRFYLNEAEQYIMEAFREKPGYYRINLVRGRILLGLKRFDEAIAVFDEAFKSHPHDIRPLFLMVECCYHKRDYQRVFELCGELSRLRMDLGEDIESIVYQWIL